MEEFEHKGEWWFPQFPGQRVVGTLKYHPVKGARLETEGNHFEPQIYELFGVRGHLTNNAIELPSNIEVDIICGQLYNGQLVTLYRLLRSDSSFYPLYIFVGCHFERGDDIVFDSMKVRYSHLEQWAGISGFTYEETSDEEKRFISNIHYEEPEAIHAKVKNFDLAIKGYFQITHDWLVKYHASQVTFIEVTPDEPMHYSMYHERIFLPLRRFLNLAIGSPIVTLDVHGQNSKFTFKGRGGDLQPRNIVVYFNPEGASFERDTQIHPLSIFFSYDEIAADFPKYLNKWFEVVERFRPVVELYFGLMYIEKEYEDVRFLQMSQALEAYHRLRDSDNTYMSPKEFETIAATVISAIPNTLKEDHRDSLESRIKYGYEYTLRTRLDIILTDVLKPYQEIVSQLIGDHKDFKNRVVATRNYFTHYTKELEKGAILDPAEQARYVRKMQLLVQLCFLAELEIPLEVVKQRGHIFLV